MARLANADLKVRTTYVLVVQAFGPAKRHTTSVMWIAV